MSPKEEYALASRLAPTLKLDEINALAALVFRPFLEQYCGPEFAGPTAEVEGAHYGGFTPEPAHLSFFVTAATAIPESGSQAEHKKSQTKDDSEDESEDEEDGEDDSEGEERAHGDEEEDEYTSEEEGKAKGEQKGSTVSKKKSRSSVLIPSHNTHSRLVSENGPDHPPEENGNENGAAKPTIPITITKEELIGLIKAATQDVKPPRNIIIPEDLVTDEQIELKKKQFQPHWVPVQTKHLFRVLRDGDNTEKEPTGEPNGALTNPCRIVHEPTEIVLLELSNGIRINYRPTTFEKQHCT